MGVSELATTHNDAAQGFVPVTRFEQDLTEAYDSLYTQGASVLVLVENSYDRDYSFFGYKGDIAPERIYEEHHNPGAPYHNRVGLLMPVTGDFAKDWPYAAGNHPNPGFEQILLFGGLEIDEAPSRAGRDKEAAEDDTGLMQAMLFPRV